MMDLHGGWCRGRGPIPDGACARGNLSSGAAPGLSDNVRPIVQDRSHLGSTTRWQSDACFLLQVDRPGTLPARQRSLALEEGQADPLKLENEANLLSKRESPPLAVKIGLRCAKRRHQFRAGSRSAVAPLRHRSRLQIESMQEFGEPCWINGG